MNSGAGSVRQSFNQWQYRTRIGGEFRLQIQFAAGKKDGDAVVANRSRDDDLVAGANRRGGQLTPVMAAQCRRW